MSEVLVLVDHVDGAVRKPTLELLALAKKLGEPSAVFIGGADKAGEADTAMLIDSDPDMPLGARLYTDNCIGCHFATGKGAPEIFPELQGNRLVNGSETKPLISVILNGAEVASTAKRPMTLRMQGYADRLSDEEVAELATWLRGAWGNDAPAISAADVAAVRASAASH